jgi:hypothetical protein
MTLSRSAGAAVLLVLAAAAPARAAESYNACQFEITALPAVLTSPGVWCLKKDLGTSIATGAAITINTNNVTVDCNGFRVSGLGAGPATSTVGVYASGRLNPVVRNCHLRGFRVGAQAAGGASAIFEDNRVEGSTHTGLNTSADHAVVRRNLVVDTVGTGFVIGIHAYYDADVIDNTVSSVIATDGSNDAYGIAADIIGGGSVTDNRVRAITATGSGDAYGILASGGSSHGVLEGNHVMDGTGEGNTGIACGTTKVKSVRNTVIGFGTTVTGCTSVDDVVDNTF